MVDRQVIVGVITMCVLGVSLLIVMFRWFLSTRCVGDALSVLGVRRRARGATRSISSRADGWEARCVHRS